MKIVRDFVQKNMEIAGGRRIKISREVTTLGLFYFDTFLRRLKWKCAALPFQQHSDVVLLINIGAQQITQSVN